MPNKLNIHLNYTLPNEREADEINKNKIASLVKHRLLNTKPEYPKDINDPQNIRIQELLHMRHPSEHLELAKHHLQNSLSNIKIYRSSKSVDLRRTFKSCSSLSHIDERVIPALYALALAKHPYVRDLDKLYREWRCDVSDKFLSIQLPKLSQQSKKDKEITDSKIHEALDYHAESFKKFHSIAIQKLQTAIP